MLSREQVKYIKPEDGSPVWRVLSEKGDLYWSTNRDNIWCLYTGSMPCKSTLGSYTSYLWGLDLSLENSCVTMQPLFQSPANLFWPERGSLWPRRAFTFPKIPKNCTLPRPVVFRGTVLGNRQVAYFDLQKGPYLEPTVISMRGYSDVDRVINNRSVHKSTIEKALLGHPTRVRFSGDSYRSPIYFYGALDGAKTLSIVSPIK